MMKKAANEAFEFWLSSPYFDEETKRELQALKDDADEIRERFGKDLEFGTGGMRGILGAGTNRFNLYTVRRATQGLADYIHSLKGGDQGVVIAFDSRHGSARCAEEAALCLNANGIPAWRFESLRPTPELSFAVRELGCIAGVVITASHNPAEYNGYKVYWEDGGQITPPHDRLITEHIQKIQTWQDVRTMRREDAVSLGLYHVIGEEIDRKYYEAILSDIPHPEISAAARRGLKIVYTPLNGTGSVPVMTLLHRLGFSQAVIVKEQADPDPEFTTCRKPNPETESAWKLALRLAEETGADLVMATDPDADRLGVYARSAEGNYVRFSGNMIGILLGDYVLRERKRSGTLPEHASIGTTIVSSRMAEPLAEKYGVSLFETLTGFKYIGEKIREFETSGESSFVFGFEESYGCLAGTSVRDKDSVSASLMMAEAAAYYKERGKTIWDAMKDLYAEFGCYREGQVSITIGGIDGIRKIQERMEESRRSPAKAIGNKAVLAVRDYRAGIRRDIITGKETPLNLPSSNVLYYELEDGWCAVRPSGTEPKIKYYFGVRAESEAACGKDYEALKEAIRNESGRTG